MSAAPGAVTLTVVGCGDAFSARGMANACFRLASATGVLVVDFGASALTAWKKQGHSTDEIDAIAVSHLHGDHFGGLPFLLLDCQYAARRKRPLALFGPPGFHERLDEAMESFFSGSRQTKWGFDWRVVELAFNTPVDAAGFQLVAREVRHPSGAPATAFRIAAQNRVIAYSGDTEWVDSLIDISANADVFVVECSGGETPVPGHIAWSTLREKLKLLTAKRIVVTHLGQDAEAFAAAMRQAGLVVAQDGMAFDV
jgi:ribonuclease BN (tRNA processing enzyme)